MLTKSPSIQKNRYYKNSEGQYIRVVQIVTVENTDRVGIVYRCLRTRKLRFVMELLFTHYTELNWFYGVRRELHFMFKKFKQK